MGIRHLLHMVFCALVITACQSEAHESVTIEEREGVTYVANHGDGAWADREDPPLTFELEQVYGTDDDTETMLAGIANLVVDDEGTLYILDNQDHRLVAFSADGSLKWTAGRQGEGPGEFNMAWGGLIWDGDESLYISNQMGSRIDRWRTDGTFVESLPLDVFELRFARPIAVIDNYLLVETGVQNERSIDLHRIDIEQWEIADTQRIAISERPLPRENMTITANLKPWDDGLVTVQGQGEYTIAQFGLDGSPQRIVTRDGEHLLPMGMYEVSGGIRIRSYSSLSGPFLLPGGYLLTSSYWATNVRDPDEHVRLVDEDRAEEARFNAALDLFDSEGRFLASMQWEDTQEPEIGTPEHAAPDGLIYTTTNDPYPQVRRYRVTVNE